MKIRVAIIFGGRSVEHEVSVISGIQAYMNMDLEKYDAIPVYMTKENELYVGEDIGKIESYKNLGELLKKSQKVAILREEGHIFLVGQPARKFGKAYREEFDIAFPVVHGTNVEDGALQGYLKTLMVPFVGCDVAASAIGMDKYASKAILKENGIPVLDCLCFTASDYNDINAMIEKIEGEIGYPAIAKPVNLGSSVGISVARDRAELERAIDSAFLYSRRVLIEHAVTNLREINCAVLGDENEAIASECEEPMHSKEILSYEDKYLSGGGKSGASKGMASVSRKIPADLSPEERERIRELAVTAFKKLGCHGVARIDFMIDKDTGSLYLNEINTIPGSLAFYLWEPVGIPYPDLLDRLIQLSMKRMREETNITYSFDTNILNMDKLPGAKGGKV